MNSIKKVFLAISVVFMGIFLASCADSIEYKTVKIKVEQNGKPVPAATVGSVLKIANFTTAEEISEYFSKNGIYADLTDEEKLEFTSSAENVYNSFACMGYVDSKGSILCKLVTRIGKTDFSYKVAAVFDNKDNSLYGIIDVDSKSENELVIKIDEKTPTDLLSKLKKQGYFEFDDIPLEVFYDGVRMIGK